MESWVGTLLVGALIYGAPLVLATMGGYCSERGGVINIGLEGKMLIAAAVTALVGAGTENAYFGLCAGIGSAVLLSWFKLALDPDVSNRPHRERDGHQRHCDRVVELPR